MPNENIEKTVEISPDSRGIKGRELEYFVWLLWKGQPKETIDYARSLVRGGIHYSALTLTAARSYFPFAYDKKEQPIRAKSIAKAFSKEPFCWEDTFMRYK